MLSGNYQTLFELVSIFTSRTHFVRFRFYTGTVFLDRTFTPNAKKEAVKSSITAHCDSDVSQNNFFYCSACNIFRNA